MKKITLKMKVRSKHRHLLKKIMQVRYFITKKTRRRLRQRNNPIMLHTKRR